VDEAHLNTPEILLNCVPSNSLEPLSVPELTLITLSHFTFFKFKDRYHNLPEEARKSFRSDFFTFVCEPSTQTLIYQVYPIETGLDFMVWSALEVDQPEKAGQFFEAYAKATNPFRHLVEPVHALWGFTRPSQYTRTRSAQEMDPFDPARCRYLILYPFVKTKEWYLFSQEARQGMMNEHIKIGKGFPEIKQLLLYSFGLQDQEFVVVYETDDLTRFSDLVYELRRTEARRYTERDNPLHTAIYHPSDETLTLFERSVD
jgi:chlorite dismutase